MDMAVQFLQKLKLKNKGNNASIFCVVSYLVIFYHLTFSHLQFLFAFAVIWRCVSTFIIFLYLMDEKTSLLVLIPAGIGSLIEVSSKYRRKSIYFT